MTFAERPPRFAGRLYPAEEALVTARLDELLGPERREEPASAVVVPHASWRLCGAVLGAVFSRVRVPGTVILLGPNHGRVGAAAAIQTRGQWRLPGFRVAIDAAVAEDLRRVALLTDDPHALDAEHALEVVLPFLVARNPRVRIVPVLLTDADSAARSPRCTRIGSALADVVASHGRDILVVASSDLAQQLPPETLRRTDDALSERIEALDCAGLLETNERLGAQMCGAVPTAVGIVAARSLGAERGERVAYATSEPCGDPAHLVGYGGFVLR